MEELDCKLEPSDEEEVACEVELTCEDETACEESRCAEELGCEDADAALVLVAETAVDEVVEVEEDIGAVLLVLRLKLVLEDEVITLEASVEEAALSVEVVRLLVSVEERLALSVLLLKAIDEDKLLD